MIFKHLGYPSTLLAVNSMPSGCASPKIFDSKVEFAEFFALLEDHFKKDDAAAVMIDDGISAMNIIGVGRSGDTFNLLINDPHTLPCHNDSIRGIYVAELDKNGDQINNSKDRMADSYPAIGSHVSNRTYKSLSFSKDYSWMILLPR